VYSYPQIDEVLTICSSNLEESGLKVEFFLVDRTWAAIPEGVYTAFELNKRANMFSVMDIETQHLSLIKICIPVRSLSPIVIADLLPYFPGFPTDRHKPIIASASKPDIFDRVPEILTFGRIRKKTPVFVLAQ
jgi:hypothetical protein